MPLDFIDSNLHLATQCQGIYRTKLKPITNNTIDPGGALYSTPVLGSVKGDFTNNGHRNCDGDDGAGGG